MIKAFTTFLNSLIAVLALVLAVSSRAQHLNAGAFGTNQDAQLMFANGFEFVNISGYVGTCIYTNGGTYAGYYGIGLNPTVLPATVANGGPVVGAPALGSFIKMRLESVVGPEGGAFGFWDVGATSPSVSVTNGGTPSAMFSLSSTATGAGPPGGDPYGHIHGRRFTVNK